MNLRTQASSFRYNKLIKAFGGGRGGMGGAGGGGVCFFCFNCFRVCFLMAVVTNSGL